MFEPMTAERREEIRAALEPLPAYPWVWDGDETSGPFLRSGDDYPSPLLSSLHGETLLFFGYDETDGFGRLHSPKRLAEKGLPNVVGHWIEHGAQYAEELLLAVDRMSRQLATAHAVRIPVDTVRTLINPDKHTRERAAVYLKAQGYQPTEAVDIWQRTGTTDLELLPGADIWADSAPHFVRNLADVLGTGELGVLAGIEAAQ